MDLEEIKAEKANLELFILWKCQEFERSTGHCITNIEEIKSSRIDQSSLIDIQVSTWSPK